MDAGLASLMVERVLMIAYHFPPIRHSSGIQRTLRFATYLRDFGWQPIVLTVNSRAYALTGDDQLGDLSDDVVVHRAFALDAKRHLGIAGRYPAFFGFPDQYSTWLLGGVPAGLALIRRYRPKVVWSTYPVATAQVLGYLLHRFSRLPWIADLRDPLVDNDYPSQPARRRWHQAIERRIAQRAVRVVLTTPSAQRAYANRFPSVPKETWALITNGYDERVFAEVETEAHADIGKRQQVLRLVHSGNLYPNERDPTAFFEAVRRLKAKRAISADQLRITLRATGHDALYRPQLRQHGIGDIVGLGQPIPYREALAEMISVDGLLLFQGGNCNRQIPTKLYEYFRAQKPIFAMTDEGGDTAQTLRSAGIGTIAPLNDPSVIAERLMEFLLKVAAQQAPVPDAKVGAAYSRRALTAQLAALLDAVIEPTRR